MSAAELVRQHLIDPEVCIRCNTCQEMCPIGAIEHDARNYVVKFEVCNWCNDCMGPCPTGAIDNARMVSPDRPYGVAEQYAWNALPAAGAQSAAGASAAAETMPADLVAAAADSAAAPQSTGSSAASAASAASAGSGVPALAPWSAAHPYTNLYSLSRPVVATVAGNYRLTADDAASEIRHLVLDFGATPFPVLEGQSIGILPPGVDADGRRLPPRQYSVASPREGERPGYNNLALTVKRVTADHVGHPAHGLCSNYLCDLQKGDRVEVTGPYGTTFLMPNHPGASLLMICTGTGAAPMRAMTERRRRRRELNEGGSLTLFFGARAPGELPYFGPLQSLPADFIDIHFAFSRVPGEPKRYVQDRLREQAAKIARLLADDDCYIYVCGLKGMEAGVVEALHDICRGAGMDWAALQPELRRKARLHIETY